jgi:hypothetical protein
VQKQVLYLFRILLQELFEFFCLQSRSDPEKLYLEQRDCELEWALRWTLYRSLEIIALQ